MISSSESRNTWFTMERNLKMIPNLSTSRVPGPFWGPMDTCPISRCPPKYSSEDWDFNNKLKLGISCDQERLAERIISYVFHILVLFVLLLHFNCICEIFLHEIVIHVVSSRMLMIMPGIGRRRSNIICVNVPRRYVSYAMS